MKPNKRPHTGLQKESQSKRLKKNDGRTVKLTSKDNEVSSDDQDDLLSFDDPFLDEEIENEETEMEAQNQQTNQNQGGLFNPVQHGLETDEKLVFENDAYNVFHRFTTHWPIPSFSIIPQPNFKGNDQYPYEVFVASATQITDKFNRIGKNNLTNRPERYHFETWKFHNLHCTQYDDDDDDDPSVLDDENLSEDPSFLCEKTVINNQIGDPNRCKAMPQNPPLVCFYGSKGRFGIYDITPLLSKVSDPSNLSNLHARAKLIWMNKDRNIGEGFGLDWSRVETGLFALGGYQKEVNVFQLDESGTVRTVAASLKQGGHTAAVEDLQFSPSEKDVLASCSCDGSICIWDLRKKNVGFRLHSVSRTDVNVIGWNTIDHYYLASGDDAGMLKVFDLRKCYQQGTDVDGSNPAVASAFYHFHRKPITGLEWNPHHSSMLATTSEEDICVVWDFSIESGEDDQSGKINEETPSNSTIANPFASSSTNQPKKNESGIYDQILFIHQGQKFMKEVHWHPQYDNLLMTCGEHSLQVWRPANLVENGGKENILRKEQDDGEGLNELGADGLPGGEDDDEGFEDQLLGGNRNFGDDEIEKLDDELLDPNLDI